VGLSVPLSWSVFSDENVSSIFPCRQDHGSLL
jgi:hypothetical protein